MKSIDRVGEPATIIDPDTGEILKAYIFVGVMSYSQYAYVEAFPDMKQKSWINAHAHTYEYFGSIVFSGCVGDVGSESEEIGRRFVKGARVYPDGRIDVRWIFFFGGGWS